MKAPDKKLKVTYIDIDQIKPWERNPKLHNEYLHPPPLTYINTNMPYNDMVTEMAIKQLGIYGLDRGFEVYSQSRLPSISNRLQSPPIYNQVLFDSNGIRPHLKVRLLCAGCGKTVLRHLSDYIYKRENQRCVRIYCSIPCYHKLVKSKTKPKCKAPAPHSQEVPCDYCGKLVLKRPHELRRSNKHFCNNKCSAHWQRAHKNGSNSHNWKGGKTKRNKLLRNRTAYFEWRQTIYNQDNFTCQKCGFYNKSGFNLHAHHKKSISKRIDLIYEPSNGITLCVKCHEETHGMNFTPKNKIGKCPICESTFTKKYMKQQYCTPECFHTTPKNRMLLGAITRAHRC